MDNKKTPAATPLPASDGHSNAIGKLLTTNVSNNSARAEQEKDSSKSLCKSP